MNIRKLIHNKNYNSICKYFIRPITYILYIYIYHNSKYEYICTTSINGNIACRFCIKHIIVYL